MLLYNVHTLVKSLHTLLLFSPPHITQSWCFHTILCILSVLRITCCSLSVFTSSDTCILSVFHITWSLNAYMYPYSNVEVAWKVQAMKVVKSGEGHRSVCVCVCVCVCVQSKQCKLRIPFFLPIFNVAIWHNLSATPLFGLERCSATSTLPSPIRSYGYTPSLFLLSRFSPPLPLRHYMDTLPSSHQLMYS